MVDDTWEGAFTSSTVAGADLPAAAPFLLPFLSLVVETKMGLSYLTRLLWGWFIYSRGEGGREGEVGAGREELV